MKPEDVAVIHFSACLIGALCLGLLLKWLWRRLWRVKRGPEPPASPPLVSLGPHDGITLHQLYEGCFVIGSIGSGKTSGPGDAIARGLLRAGAGFCVLCAKPDEARRWQRLTADCGRANDYVRFGPGSPLRLDVLDFTLRQPGATADGAAELMNTLLRVTSRDGGGGGDDRFWALLAERMMRWLISLVWMAKGRASISDLYRALTSIATSPEQAAGDEWKQNSYCGQCLTEVVAKGPALPQHEVGLCVAFWFSEMPALSEKTRNIGVTMVLNVLEKFLVGPVAEAASSGETNFTPADIGAGRVCLLDYPYLRYRDAGRLFAILVKALVQRHCLARDVGPGTRPVVVFQDEGQLYLTEMDVEVQTVARQSRLINVFLSQNLPTLYEALGGGQRAEQQAQALIGNLQTKFLCQQSDKATNEYFSELLGSSRHLFMSGSTPTGPSSYDPVSDWLGTESPNQQQGSAGFNEQWHPDVAPAEFTKLAKGGHENRRVVEAICFQGGRVWSNGKTHMKCRFLQQ